MNWMKIEDLKAEYFKNSDDHFLVSDGKKTICAYFDESELFFHMDVDEENYDELEARMKWWSYFPVYPEIVE